MNTPSSNNFSRREFLVGAVALFLRTGAASARTVESGEMMNHPGVQFLLKWGFELDEIIVEPYDYLGEQARFPTVHSNVNAGFCIRVSSAGIQRVFGGNGAEVDLIFSFKEFKRFSPRGIEPQHYWDRRYGLSVFPAFQEGAVSQFTVGSASLDSLEDLDANVNLGPLFETLRQRLNTEEGTLFIDRLMHGYGQEFAPLQVEAVSSLPGNQRLKDFLNENLG